MSTPRTWDDSYTGETPAPWDIGRPQPTFLRLAEEGLLAGRVLDAGCGTGECHQRPTEDNANCVFG